jgi:hypothetical protein
VRPLIYTDADSERAHKEWKATCGPHSLAAACGKTLDEVHAIMPANYKGWMSPTMVCNALGALGMTDILYQTKLKTDALCNGINRVQWEGKWLNPGVPARVAYFHTHLVAHFYGFVLCTGCETAKWIPEGEWRDFLLNENDPQPFHITHHWRINWKPSRNPPARPE